MPGSWRDGLVNAFPIPEDKKIRKGHKKEVDGDNNNNAIEDEQGASSSAASSSSEPFAFFNLPSELRNRIYNLVLFSKPAYRGADGRRKGSRTAVLQASKRFHEEASYVLYTTHSFRIFKLQDFLFLPAIQELPPHYRALVTNLELVVGSSWTNPPKAWRVSKLVARCLTKMQLVRTLKIFVECDPSQPSFEKYRVSRDFYTDFCGDLVRDALQVMPQLKFVELDGNPSVEVDGPLVTRLHAEATAQRKLVYWGKQNGWGSQVRKPV